MVYKTKFARPVSYTQPVFVIESHASDDIFYAQVEKVLCFSNRSGRNKDALLDILRGGFTDKLTCSLCRRGFSDIVICEQCELGIKIILRNSRILRPNLLSVFRYAAEENAYLTIEYK